MVVPNVVEGRGQTEEDVQKTRPKLKPKKKAQAQEVTEDSDEGVEELKGESSKSGERRRSSLKSLNNQCRMYPRGV